MRQFVSTPTSPRMPLIVISAFLSSILSRRLCKYCVPTQHSLAPSTPSSSTLNTSFL
ncbi:hypothetical protein BDR05DRAFT_955189, partial [Suillus weaverae]